MKETMAEKKDQRKYPPTKRSKTEEQEWKELRQMGTWATKRKGGGKNEET